MLLGTFCVTLLENILTGISVIRAGDGAVLAGGNFFMPSHPWSNFELQRFIPKP